MMDGRVQGKTLSNVKAEDALTRRRGGQPSFKLLDSDFGSVAGNYDWDESRADAAAYALSDIANGLRDAGKRVDAFEFDSVACAELHRRLDPLPPQLAASEGFWRWLVVEKFSDVIEMRMGSADNPANPANYGIYARIESNRLAILWFRAEILFSDEFGNPYELATRKMHTDFVESGLIRPRYAWCATVARAFVRFQYRDPESNRSYLHNTHANGIRAMYKMLRRLQSAHMFEAMSYEELWELLNEKSEGLEPGNWQR